MFYIIAYTFMGFCLVSMIFSARMISFCSYMKKEGLDTIYQCRPEIWQAYDWDEHYGYAIRHWHWTNSKILNRYLYDLQIRVQYNYSLILKNGSQNQSLPTQGGTSKSQRETK